MQRAEWVIATIVAAAASGCDMGASRQEEEARRQEAYDQRQILQPAPPVRPQLAEDDDAVKPIAEAYRATQSNLEQIGQPEEIAIRRIGRAIDASLELGPTLVVWLIDRTPSSEGLVMQSLLAARRLYDAPQFRQQAGDDAPLLSAVIAFDEQSEFLVDPPTVDARQVQSAFDAIRRSSGGRELTFTALREALVKYLHFRTDERREVLLVVVTDEAGDDSEHLGELIATTRRQAIPVYVVGLPAPWGQVSPFAADPKDSSAVSGDAAAPKVGPDSLSSERVDIQGWSTSYSDRPSLDLVDSGFGPFALERLCRASRGQFFAIRPAVNEYGYAMGGLRFRTWPTGAELRFDEGIAARYAPDYVSEEDYRKLLSENKARGALHEAAKQPKLAIVGLPDTRFAKGSEAEMARRLSQAQQFAAQHSPPVDRLYALLSPAEADRERLSGPRWQAQYDLAMGRVLAVKARLDGYNSMIAALKRGRSFEKESSTTWVLEPADAFETESTIKRLAERAKTYLARVQSDHPGTPWAVLAEEELKTPLGWRWREE